MLTWKYSFKEISIGGLKGGGRFTLVRGEDASIIMQLGSMRFKVDPMDICKVRMFQPKLFSKGYISFIDENDEILVYVCEGREVSLVVEVANKEKDAFYTFFSILKDNGFVIEAY